MRERERQRELNVWRAHPTNRAKRLTKVTGAGRNWLRVRGSRSIRRGVAPSQNVFLQAGGQGGRRGGSFRVPG